MKRRWRSQKRRDDLSKVGCDPAGESSRCYASRITDKSKTYDMIKTAGLKVPEYTVVSEMPDIYHAVKFYGYPQRTVVVKPAAGRGGARGVCAIG